MLCSVSTFSRALFRCWYGCVFCSTHACLVLAWVGGSVWGVILVGKLVKSREVLWDQFRTLSHLIPDGFRHLQSRRVAVWCLNEVWCGRCGVNRQNGRCWSILHSSQFWVHLFHSLGLCYCTKLAVTDESVSSSYQCPIRIAKRNGSVVQVIDAMNLCSVAAIALFWAKLSKIRKRRAFCVIIRSVFDTLRVDWLKRKYPTSIRSKQIRW